MNDERIWVPVEVIWDEDLWEADPWRSDPRGRAARPAATARAGSAYGWPEGWPDDDEDLPEEGEWGTDKPFRQDGAGLSKRKRKKLRAQDRGAGR